VCQGDNRHDFSGSVKGTLGQNFFSYKDNYQTKLFDLIFIDPKTPGTPASAAKSASDAAIEHIKKYEGLKKKAL
jgi:hypothetical protein